MFIESTKNSKRKSYQSVLLPLYVFWYEWNNFHAYVFTSMHVLNFMSWVCMLWIWNSQWLEIIILRSPEKGAPWKFWLDPRFPRDPKLKWILKWLLLDRGYFKVFFFTKRESLLIISCYVYLSIRNLVVCFKSFSHCHAFSYLKCSVIRHY